MRYCVLSIPRTGSTWLNSGIGSCFSRLKNYINLNEFFTPFVNNNHYKLDDNNMIYHAVEIADKFEIYNINEFNKFRMDILLSGNVKQPLLLKYMYWPFQGSLYNDLENLKKIKNHNINIININRNAFESAVSYYVVNDTGIIHKYGGTVGNITWYHTNAGKTLRITQPKVEIDINDFEIIYIQFIEAAIYKQKMADILDCVTVNYDSLRMDCLKNKIPFQSISHLKKLYDEDYSSIITNYDKMLETKTKVEKMMNFSDTMGTKKQ